MGRLVRPGEEGLALPLWHLCVVLFGRLEEVFDFLLDPINEIAGGVLWHALLNQLRFEFYQQCASLSIHVITSCFS